MSAGNNDTQISFGPICPSGSSWYTCGDIFLGCCASYACGTNGCAQGNIRPVAFDPDQYGKFPDAGCGRSSNFFTCTGGPTFWGCCKSNPCAAEGICPSNDLTGALMDTPAQSAYYLHNEISPTATGSPASPTATGATSISSPSSTPSNTAPASSDHSNKNTGAIAGGSAAGGVVVALLVCWLLYYLCYVKKSRKKHKDQLESRQSDLAIAAMTENPNKAGAPHHLDGAPPGYSSPNPNLYPYGHQEPNYYAYQQDAASSVGSWRPQQQRASELSADAALRGELESPMPSPQKFSTPHTPKLAPTQEEPTWVEYNPQAGAADTQSLGIYTPGGHGVVQDEYQSRRN